jgi:endonuclease/exonuclease/phosphatase family metal-dependent hydrolase
VPEGEPTVVAGDLNEGATGPAWQTLAARLPPVTPDAPTFPARHPQHRIDAIFVSPQLRAVDGRPRPDFGAGDLVAATDHLPVWVDLDVSVLAR